MLLLNRWKIILPLIITSYVQYVSLMILKHFKI